MVLTGLNPLLPSLFEDTPPSSFFLSRRRFFFPLCKGISGLTHPLFADTIRIEDYRL